MRDLLVAGNAVARKDLMEMLVIHAVFNDLNPCG